jgi:hypothetical protein
MLKSESFQLRLTKPQMDRLTEVMRVTGLGKAEHIRRAVDYYLAGWRDAAPPEPVRVPATSPLAQAEPAPVSTPKTDLRQGVPVSQGQDTPDRRVKVARR